MSQPNEKWAAEIIAKVGFDEARILAFAYHLHTKKPCESDAACIAGARWMMPYLRGDKE